MTKKNAAPHELLKIIHCNCLGNANPLDAATDAMNFTAVSTVACGPCQTENCDNPSNTQEVDTDEEDDTLN